MTVFAQWLLWLALAGVFYTFVGYPLLVGVLARWRRRPVAISPWQPSVTVCIAMHNGSRWLDAKLDNLLSHDYPSDRLSIIVVSDGSDDDSVERLRARAGDRVTPIIESQRRGKTACLRQAIDQASGEVLVFTDIRQRLEPGSIGALCAALASGDLKVVSGALAFESVHGYAASVDAYWRYESWLRRAEAASGSVVGVTGALYAVRRADMPLPPPNLVLDDVWVPMQIAARGGRVGIEPRAIAWDLPSANAQAEAARKRRTLAGNWQLLALWPRLLVPGAHPLWWRYVSHKVLRLLVPAMLSVAFVSNAVLVTDSLEYFALMLAQLSGYGVAVVGLTLPQWRRWLPVKLSAAFLEMNLYAWAGWLDFLRQRDAHLWKSNPVPDSAGSPP